LELDLKEGVEFNAVGIEKLLADYDDTIAIIPADNERMNRRNDNSDET
jgi:lysine 2,3-aminomutase